MSQLNAFSKRSQTVPEESGVLNTFVLESWALVGVEFFVILGASGNQIIESVLFSTFPL